MDVPNAQADAKAEGAALNGDSNSRASPSAPARRPIPGIDTPFVADPLAAALPADGGSTPYEPPKASAAAVAPFAQEMAPAAVTAAHSDLERAPWCPVMEEVCAPCDKGFSAAQRLYAVQVMNQLSEASWGFIYLFARESGHGPIALTLFYTSMVASALLTALTMGAQTKPFSGHLFAAFGCLLKSVCIMMALAMSNGSGAAGSTTMLLLSGMVYGVFMCAFWTVFNGMFMVVSSHRDARGGASGTLFILVGFSGAAIPTVAGVLIDLCGGQFMPLFLITASLALTTAVGLVRLSMRPDTIPVCFGPSGEVLRNGRKLLPMLAAEGLWMSVFQFVPGLVTLRFSDLTSSGLSFGGFQSAMSALGGIASFAGGKWSDKSGGGDRSRPLTVGCALAFAGVVSMFGAHSSLIGWTVAYGVTNFAFLLLSTITFTLIADHAADLGISPVQAMWMREVVYNSVRCVVAVMSLIVQVSGGELAGMFLFGAICLCVLWVCWQRRIRDANLQRVVQRIGDAHAPPLPAAAEASSAQATPAAGATAMTVVPAPAAAAAADVLP